MAKVILIRETLRQSYKRDGGSVLAALALLLPGYLLDSLGLSIAGGLMLVVIALKWLTGKTNEMSIDEARAFLDAIEEDSDPDAHEARK